MRIFFNSSMPRSGSTLIQNILGTNPNFHVSPTSGVLELINASRRVYTLSPTFKAQKEEEVQKAFIGYCKNAIYGYYTAISNKPYAIDKSRGWALNYDFLSTFIVKPKIIFMVRDLRDIISSMEKNHQRNPEKWDLSMDEDPKGVGIGDRINLWLANNSRPVGDTLNRLKEVIFKNYDKHIHFVRYEDLCSNPQKTMDGIYKYLEVPKYEHDFNNIPQITFEDDKFHGKYGVHTIRNKVEVVKSDAIKVLGIPLCKQIYDNNYWYFSKFKYKEIIW